MSQTKPARILVLRGGAIGDFIMTLPSIGALRERWPAARIEILGYPHIIELAHQRHYADGIRSIEARALASFFVPQGNLDAELIQYFSSFSLVVSHLYDPDDIFGGNVRRCGVRQLLTGSPRPTNLHAADHYCLPLQSLAIYVEHARPRVYPSATDKAYASAFMDTMEPQLVVAIHPGSGSERKNWPVEKYASICRWLIDELAVQLLVVKGEADERVVESLLTALAPRRVRLAAGLTLVELAAVLERCSLFLGNDSGITHLAAAVDTRTIALFGPASTATWIPRGPRVRVIPFGDSDIALVRRAIAENGILTGVITN